MGIIYLDDRSLNEKVLSIISELPDSLRKEIRLLSKQYKLIEFYQKESIEETFEDGIIRLIRPAPFVLKYSSLDGKEVFEWEIDVSKFR